MIKLKYHMLAQQGKVTYTLLFYKGRTDLTFEEQLVLKG